MRIGGQPETILQPTLAETGFIMFLRTIAGFCLLFGIFYWIRLIGIYEGDAWRFDTMPIHWKAGATALAVMFPITAIGLWLLASWGPVLWLACAAIEATMYVAYADLFGFRPTLIVAHLSIAGLYVAFRLYLWWQAKHRKVIT